MIYNGYNLNTLMHYGCAVFFSYFKNLKLVENTKRTHIVDNTELTYLYSYIYTFTSIKIIG